jgi:hypothetical protein
MYVLPFFFVMYFLCACNLRLVTPEHHLVNLAECG